MSECLPLNTDERICGARDIGLLVCMKPEGHTGDRHGYDIGWMSAAWGYVPTADEASE